MIKVLQLIFGDFILNLTFTRVQYAESYLIVY